MKDLIKDIGPTLVSLFAVSVSLVSIFLVYRVNRQTLIQKQHEEERKEIYKKLNFFYGPFRQCLGISFELYGRFTYAHQEGMRTLVMLLNGTTFEGNDEVLLKQILEVEDQMSKLMFEQSGLIDDKELQELLAKVATHFRLIKLAYERVLQGESERFKDYVFPREITPRIDAEIRKLNMRLRELNTEVRKGPFAQLLASIKSKGRHVEADERGPVLNDDDYQMSKVMRDLKEARLILESVEERLLRTEQPSEAISQSSPKIAPVGK